MAIVVSSKMTLSIGAGVKTADQIEGRNQYVGKGKITLVAKASAAAATGIRATLSVGGISLIDDQMVPFAGTTGGLSMTDNVVLTQAVAGGRVELNFRNDSAGTLTTDYQLLFTPM